MSKIATHLRGHFVAYLALFFALGGTSVAAVNALPKNSVGSPQIKNGSIQKVDISKRTVSALRGLRGPRGLTGATGATGAAGAPGAKGDTGLPGVAGNPSTAGRVAVTNVTSGPAIVAGTTDLGSVSITVPSDAHFVHVTSGVTLFSAAAAANVTFWIVEGSDCSGSIVEETRAFSKLETTSDVVDVGTQGVFGATAGVHTYRFCLITGGAMSSGWIHIVAAAEAANGTGGTSAPAFAGGSPATRAASSPTSH